MAVYLLPIVGAVALEAIIGIFAAVSLWIVFTMRPWFTETQSVEVTAGE